MTANRYFLLVFLIGFNSSSSLANACPLALKSLNSQFITNETLCDLADRYALALQQIEQNGARPADRVAALLAPRMINMSDWLTLREAKNFDPYLIYEPAPKTWKLWENGAKIIDEAAHLNVADQNLKPLTLEQLRQIQKATIADLVPTSGNFRQGGEVGRVIYHSVAVTPKQSRALRRVEYKSLLHPERPILRWHATLCLQERLPEFQDQFNNANKIHSVFDVSQWPDIDPDKFFIDTDGREKQCGYILYADPNEVEPQMEKWLEFINGAITQWNRWFIAIHPFESGNGRTSRFVMDYLLKSLGLPSPLLEDMNEDLYHTEETWAQEIAVGLHRAVLTAESCAEYPQARGCQAVPRQP
jgi:hypothetical protein